MRPTIAQKNDSISSSSSSSGQKINRTTHSLRCTCLPTYLPTYQRLAGLRGVGHDLLLVVVVQQQGAASLASRPRRGSVPRSECPCSSKPAAPNSSRRSSRLFVDRIVTVEPLRQDLCRELCCF